MFRQRIADVTKNLLILNIAVWVIGLFALFQFGNNLNETLGLFHFQSPEFRPWQIITSMFSHALYHNGGVYFYHILFNMFMLYMFGSPVEYGLGKKKFFILYMIAGFGASFLHQGMGFIMNDVNPNIPLVGASGAIYGVLLTFAYLNPNARLMLLIPPIPVKAKILIPILMVVELVLAFGNLPGDFIAHFAHLGGALFAFITLLVWKIKPNRY